jgi:hypothetical protein
MAPLMAKLYPRATEDRLLRANPAAAKMRNAFFKASGKNFLLLQLLFLTLFSWIFGALYQQESHTHNLAIAFVDYDRGAIGQAVREAYSRLQGDKFPSLVEQRVVDFSTPGDLRNAVCRTEFWAALYVSEGASARLHDALSGDSVATYDPSNVLTYIWNEARYPAVVDSAISSSLQTLSSAARVAYASGNGTGRIQDTSLSSPSSLTVLANPWTLASINIKPTSQGSRAIYNTVVIILIMIQEFFYLGTINGLYVAFKIYQRMHPYRIVVFRFVNSFLYTMVGSLCTVGAIWAFRSGWHVDGTQFVLSWIALWLFAHVNFQALDVFTIWLPLPYVPMALISWVIVNVTSILLPFELSPGFFKVGYAIPAHEVYQTLTDIWSGGCNPRLYYALPVLVVWWIVTFFLAAVGVFKRCHYATLGEEEQARQFRERLDAAMGFEGRREEEERKSVSTGEQGPAETRLLEDDTVTKMETPACDASIRERRGSRADLEEELAQVMSRTDARLRREQTRASNALDCGPAFHLPFGRDGEGEQ